MMMRSLLSELYLLTAPSYRIAQVMAAWNSDLSEKAREPSVYSSFTNLHLPLLHDW